MGRMCPPKEKFKSCPLVPVSENRVGNRDSADVIKLGSQDEIIPGLGWISPIPELDDVYTRR